MAEIGPCYVTLSRYFPGAVVNLAVEHGGGYMRPLKVEELELVAGSGVGQDSADYNGYSGDDMDYDHGAMAQANAILMSSYDPATNSYTVTDDFIAAFQAAYPDTFHYEGSQPDAYTYQMVEDYAAHYGYGQVNFS